MKRTVASGLRAVIVGAALGSLAGCADTTAVDELDILPQFGSGDPGECFYPTDPDYDPLWECRQSTNTERRGVKDHADILDSHFSYCAQAANHMRGYYYQPATYRWNIYRHEIPGEYGHTHSWGSSSDTHSWQERGTFNGGFPRHVLHEVLHRVLPSWSSENDIDAWADICEGNA